MKITYTQIKKLKPCYTDLELRGLLPIRKRIEITLEGLLYLEKSDARWLVSRLMTRPALIVWSQTCSKRANKYAAAAAAAAAAAWAADDAAAAAWAADDAAAAADWAVVEHRIAMKHAIALLNDKGIK